MTGHIKGAWVVVENQSASKTLQGRGYGGRCTWGEKKEGKRGINFPVGQ